MNTSEIIASLEVGGEYMKDYDTPHMQPRMSKSGVHIKRTSETEAIVYQYAENKWDICPHITRTDEWIFIDNQWDLKVNHEECYG